MNNTRKAIWGFILLIIIPGMIYIGYWLTYYSSLKKATSSWIAKNYTNQSFKGLLTNIIDCEGMYEQGIGVLLELNTPEGEKIICRCSYVNTDFISSVNIGDSVIKKSGSDSLLFIKANGKVYKSKFTFCSP